MRLFSHTLLASLIFVGGVCSQIATERFDELEGVEVTEKLGDQVPLELTFRGENGEPVQLSRYLDGTLPVILTMNYSDCPLLCSLQITRLVEDLRGLSWSIGKEFRILTVSLDPKESPKTAAKTKAKYIAMYEDAKFGKKGAAAGWSFLTGKEEDIQALASSVGFGYRYLPETGDYTHKAVNILLSPEGKVTRYLEALQVLPKDLRLALIEAGDGKVGSYAEIFFQSCFYYDPDSKSYALSAFRLMQIGGAGFIVLMAIGFFFLRRKPKPTPVPVGA